MLGRRSARGRASPSARACLQGQRATRGIRPDSQSRAGSSAKAVSDHLAPLCSRFAIVAVSLLVAAMSIGLSEGGSQASTGVAVRGTVTLRIIFPEGFSARQMIDRVAAVRRIAIAKRAVTPRLTARDYRSAVRRASEPQVFRRYMRRRSIEGFLFPALYEFTELTTSDELVAKQLEAFRDRWSTVDLRRARGRNPYDVLTIASMIEREVVVPRERALVSAVIHNRLALGMPLGIDATIRYALGIPGTRPLRREHLESSSPYNTRRFKGLPPTPIGNPGLASIRAAAGPADVDYLYFVRKPDKRHHFFTADQDEFCEKSLEYGYGGC